MARVELPSLREGSETEHNWVEYREQLKAIDRFAVQDAITMEFKDGANHTSLGIANDIRNVERSPAKLRNGAASAAVLVLDSQPVGPPGIEESGGYIWTRSVVRPVVNDQLLVEVNPNSGIRSGSKNMKRGGIAPDHPCPSHREF